MELTIRLRHGRAYGLVLRIPKEELADCLLSMPGWAELVDSYGYIRHRVPQMPPEIEPPASQDPRTGEWKKGYEGIQRYKLPPEDHLGLTVRCEGSGALAGLSRPDNMLLDRQGRPTRRLILIGNRNLGNNHWFVAWHEGKKPHCFRLKAEPVKARVYTCLVCYKTRDLAIEPLRFRPRGDDFMPYRAKDDADVSDKISWCTYGQQVLHGGAVADIEEILEQFYDFRHVLYFPVMRGYKQGKQQVQRIYEGYPHQFKDRLRQAWQEGHPRSRYLHNAVGIGRDRIVIVQRHGTVEEIAEWLREEGAEDGLILDNGGSVFTWAWWAFREAVKSKGKGAVKTGNVIFSAPDWRRPTISLIAFVLKGPPRHSEPLGAVAFAMG